MVDINMNTICNGICKKMFTRKVTTIKYFFFLNNPVWNSVPGTMTKWRSTVNMAVNVPGFRGPQNSFWTLITRVITSKKQLFNCWSFNRTVTLVNNWSWGCTWSSFLTYITDNKIIWFLQENGEFYFNSPGGGPIFTPTAIFGPESGLKCFHFDFFKGPPSSSLPVEYLL